MKLFLITVIFPFILFAQEISNTINVRATSNIFVPADQVKLSININSEDPDPRNAYQHHKSLEAKLLELIKKYKIPDSLISYSLPSYRSGNVQPGQPPRFQTSQEVMIRLRSVADYTDFQLELFENGFYNFRASFMTERIDEQKKQGYEAALKLAKTDALMIAQVMGRELGEIITITVTTTDFPYVDTQQAGTYFTAKTTQKDLTEINQSIQIRTDLNVVFEIED